MDLKVNNQSLQTFAWNIKSVGDRWQVPGVTQKNVSPATRHGSIWTPNKTFEENKITLSMWAVGSNSDGTFPSGSRAQKCRDNLDALVRIFGIRHSLLTVIQTDDNGSTRQVFAEVQESIDFSTMAGGSRAQFAVTLVVPGVFWEDTSDQTYTSATSLTPATVMLLSPFSGATAPMTELSFQVKGPATNPKLTDTQTGVYVQYNGTVANGSTWTLNSKGFTSTVGASNVIGSTVHSAPGPLMTMTAPVGGSGNPVLRLDGSTFGSATQVIVTGRRKYLLA